MVDNSAQTVGPVNVWTLPPRVGAALPLGGVGYAFPWSWGWQINRRLIPRGTFSRRPGAMGTGNFQLLRETRQEPNQSQFKKYSNADGSGEVTAGQYVAITAISSPFLTSAPTQIDPAKVLWWGWISRIEYNQLAGSIEGIGAAYPAEVGNLLDQQQVTGWARVTADGGYGEPLNTPPTANMADAAGYVIGNAKAVSNLLDGGGTGTDGLGTAAYAFARYPSDCGQAAGNLWTRWRLLRHLIIACKRLGLPPLKLVCADGSQALDPAYVPGVPTIAGYLNDTTAPEVFDLRNLTFKGAIDLLIPRSRGFNWTLELLDQTGWSIVVYSYASDTTYGLPVNTANGSTSYTAGTNGLNFDPADASGTGETLLTEVTPTSDVTDLPDEVQVEGAPIIFGATVGFPDGSAAVGWQRGAGNAEDTFRQGGNTAGLTAQQASDLHAMIRSSPMVRDVYVRYGLYSYANGEVQIADPPVTGIPRVSLVPELSWDGSTVTIPNLNKSRCPYLPAACLLRTLPWPEGVKADGTDLRPSISKSQPQFMKPKLFIYDSTQTQLKWIDLDSRQGRGGYPSMHLDVEDRGLAFRVQLPQNEMLAYRHFRDAAGGTTTPVLVDGYDPDLASNSIDYNTLVATIALESDQRVLVKIRRPGLQSDSEIRKSAIIRDANLQCWVMRLGTVIGVKADQTPDRITSGAGAGFAPDGAAHGVLVRNDWPLAQKRANMLAAWYFRARRSVTISRARPDSPPTWARVGYLITKTVEKSLANVPSGMTQSQFITDFNTVVEEVSFDFSLKPRVSVATCLPPPPGFVTAGGASMASGGGAVSCQLGGNAGQVAQSLQQAGAGLVQDTQRVPVIVPRSPISNGAQMTLVIIDGNTLVSGQLGIKSVATFATVTSLWDPAAGGTYQDGIGRATLYRDGVSQGTVLVANDSRAGITSSLVTSWKCRAAASVRIPWVTDPTQSILVYIPAGA